MICWNSATVLSGAYKRRMIGSFEFPDPYTNNGSPGAYTSWLV